MSQQNAKDIAAWMKGTDLVEVSYRKGADKVRLGFDDAPRIPASTFPGCSLTPVTSPEVGIFRWAKVGQSGALEKGAEVKKGQKLGMIETAGKPCDVTAPVSGTLTGALVDDGAPLEYGQPLFFIEPRG